MVRPAKIHDVQQMVELINSYANQDIMLPRTPMQIYKNIRDYVVVSEGDKIIGVGALSVLWEDLAEVRSLAISPDQVGKGLGRKIVEHLLGDAKNLDMSKVFTLTYQPEFFKKLGFASIDKQELPHKVWSDCINCHKFPNCDENALIINLQV